MAAGVLEAPGGAVGALCARCGVLAFACLPQRPPAGAGAGPGPPAPPLPRVFVRPAGAGGCVGSDSSLRELRWPPPLDRAGAGDAALALGGARLCAASCLGAACWEVGSKSAVEGRVVATGRAFSGSIALSPDGRFLAGAGLEGGPVTVLDLGPPTQGEAGSGDAHVPVAASQPAKVLASLEAPTVASLTFGGHNPALLVATCGDRTVRVWDLHDVAGGGGLHSCSSALPAGALPTVAVVAAPGDVQDPLGTVDKERDGEGEFKEGKESDRVNGTQGGARPSDTRCIMGSTDGSVLFYDLSGEQCPLIQMFSTVLAVREAVGGGPSLQDATSQRADIRAAAFAPGRAVSAGKPQASGEGLSPGIVLASPDSLLVLDGETYEVLHVVSLDSIGGPSNVVALDFDSSTESKSRRSRSTSEVVCYLASPFSSTISMVRIDLGVILAGVRERSPLSVFPSSKSEEDPPLDSVLEKAMALLDLGDGPGDHRPPPATFGGRKVKSSGYGMTHPRRFLGQPVKGGKPVRAGARAKRGPGMQHEYPMQCGPLIEFQEKNATRRKLHKGPIMRMEYSPDGAHLLTCGADHSAVALRLPVSKYSGECPPFLGHDGPVTCGSWSQSGRLCLTGSGDRTVALWAPGRAEPLMRISHTVRNLPFAGQEGRGSGRKPNPTLTGTVTAVSFLHMDQVIVASSSSHVYLYKYRLPKGEQGYYHCAADIRSEAHTVTDFACFNGFVSNLLVCGTSARSLEVHDVAAGRVVRTVRGAHARAVARVALPSSSKYTSLPQDSYNLFASAAADGCIRVWDLRAPTCVRCLRGHTTRQGQPTGIAFSPCMKFLSTGSEDRAAFMYDLGTGQAVYKIRHGHRDAVTDVAYNPAYPQMATATGDGGLNFFSN